MSVSCTIAARVAERCQAADLPITAAGVAAVAQYLDGERASDRQSHGLVGQVESVPVHGERNAG